MRLLFILMMLFAANVMYAQQCTATTQAGHTCTRKAKVGTLCSQHADMAARPVRSSATKPAAKVCGADTKSGDTCRNRTTNPNGRCHLHNK